MKWISLIAFLFCSLCVNAQPYQKPGADFRWVDASRIELDEGETRVITIRLETNHRAGPAVVHLLPSEGLASPDFERQWQFDLSNHAMELEIEISAEHNGRSSIGVLVEYLGETRVLGRAVYVGGYKAWKAQQQKTSNSAYRSLSAQEVIR